MKKRFIKTVFLCFVWGLLLGSFRGVTAQNTVAVPIKVIKPERKSDFSTPVTAFVDKEMLSLYFEEPLGEVFIRIESMRGDIVLQEILDGTDEEHKVLHIPVYRWEYDNYLITIIYGEFVLQGEFVIEKEDFK